MPMLAMRYAKRCDIQGQGASLFISICLFCLCAYTGHLDTWHIWPLWIQATARPLLLARLLYYHYGSHTITTVLRTIYITIT